MSSALQLGNEPPHPSFLGRLKQKIRGHEKPQAYLQRRLRETFQALALPIPKITETEISNEILAHFGEGLELSVRYCKGNSTEPAAVEAPGRKDFQMQLFCKGAPVNFATKARFLPDGSCKETPCNETRCSDSEKDLCERLQAVMAAIERVKQGKPAQRDWSLTAPRPSVESSAPPAMGIG